MFRALEVRPKKMKHESEPGGRESNKKDSRACDYNRSWLFSFSNGTVKVNIFDGTIYFAVDCTNRT